MTSDGRLFVWLSTGEGRPSDRCRAWTDSVPQLSLDVETGEGDPSDRMAVAAGAGGVRVRGMAREGEPSDWRRTAALMGVWTRWVLDVEAADGEFLDLRLAALPEFLVKEALGFVAGEGKPSDR